ncbi:MAG: hypothetical protein IKQ39_00740 [Oscillospiraceae bacterium]|nr:hypothetical protein [Oscillospiraceae bacterium]
MPICKNCGEPAMPDSVLCMRCAEQQRPHRRPLYIIPVILLFSLLMLFTVLYFRNSPEKRAETMLNSFAKGYLTGDTEAALSIMPQCEITDLKREWGEDGYKEFIHTSLVYGKAEFLDANYGENVSVRFRDIACKEMKPAKIHKLEKHLKSVYHAEAKIQKAYYVSCTVCVSGSERSEELPSSDHLVLIKIGGKWSLYGTSPEMLAPDNQV